MSKTMSGTLTSTSYSTLLCGVLSMLSATASGASLSLLVDRDQGELRIENLGTSGAEEFIGYTIASPAGGLVASNWTSIAATYDIDGSSPIQISSDTWLELSSSKSELSEFDFESIAGASLAASSGISLGLGSWLPSPYEDLTFTYVLPNRDQVQGSVFYSGNNGTPFDTGDLDTDGDIDADDWGIFYRHLGGTLGSLSVAEAYRLGDLDGNKMVDLDDFVRFRELFQAANSTVALVGGASVPEPTTGVLALLGGSFSLQWLVRRRRQQQATRG